MERNEIMKEAINIARKRDDSTAFPFFNWEEAGIPFGVVMQNVNNIVYDHNFAKAFWGESNYILCLVKYEIHDDEISYETNDLCWIKDSDEFENIEEFFRYNVPEWRYRLEEMVAYQDPLDYIEDFIH